MFGNKKFESPKSSSQKEFIVEFLVTSENGPLPNKLPQPEAMNAQRYAYEV